jgi:hypothetical protein
MPAPDAVSAESWPGQVRRRETLLRLPIGELVDWHLMALCASCRAERILPIRDLTGRFGDAATLAVLVPRLRCGTASCRRPPARVRLRSRFPIQPGPPIVDIVLLERRPPGQAV